MTEELVRVNKTNESSCGKMTDWRMTLIRRCINEGYFRARRVHRRSGRSSTADRHPSTEPNIAQRGGHTGDAMKMDVLNRGAVGENDVPRPCYRPAVSATGEEQSSDEGAAASRSSTESARRSSGRLCVRRGNNGKTIQQGPSSRRSVYNNQPGADDDGGHGGPEGLTSAHGRRGAAWDPSASGTYACVR